MNAADVVVGQRYRLTPSAAHFLDPGDYAYVTRPEGPAGKVFEAESVNEPTPFYDFLPRSGVPTVTLISRVGETDQVVREFLAVGEELTPVFQCDDCRSWYDGPVYYTLGADVIDEADMKLAHLSGEPCTDNLCPGCAGPYLTPDDPSDPRRPAE